MINGRHEEELRRLHKVGYSTTEISEMLFISNSSARLGIKEYGLTPNKPIEKIQKMKMGVNQTDSMSRRCMVDYIGENSMITDSDLYFLRRFFELEEDNYLSDDVIRRRFSKIRSNFLDKMCGEDYKDFKQIGFEDKNEKLFIAMFGKSGKNKKGK